MMNNTWGVEMAPRWPGWRWGMCDCMHVHICRGRWMDQGHLINLLTQSPAHPL